jgi:hypothetical protein
VAWREVVRDWGLGLTVLGSLVLILSLVWVVVCVTGYIGPCLGTPFVGRQGILEFTGVVIFALGLFLVFVGRRAVPATH